MNLIGSLIGRRSLMVGLLVSAGPALAAGSDDGFPAFWAQFKAAVGKSDQNAVSQMIKYPVHYNDLRQATDFPAIWKGAFNPANRRCLAKQKPIKDTQESKIIYSAYCGQVIYFFSKVDAGWKLTEFGVND